jgi:hypothetical protein
MVCDDGSVDRTGELAARRGAEVIRHARHQGYGAALAALFRRGRELHPDVLVTVNAADPHLLGDIPRLVIPILKGEADVVVGSQRRGEGRGAVEKAGEAGLLLVSKRAQKTSSPAISGDPTGVRAYSRRAVEAVMPTWRGPEASTEIVEEARDRGLVITVVLVSAEASSGCVD